MDTDTQRSDALFKRFGRNITAKKRKLLVAAAVLFCLGWSVVSPVQGIECLIPQQLKFGEKVIIEQADNNALLSELNSCSFTERHLVGNVLASAAIAEPADASETEYSNNDAGIATAQGNALLSRTSPAVLISDNSRKEIISYTVQEGDTPSHIAASFGISLETLLWANKLSATTIIRPGDTLTILPVTGLLHRVKSNETVSWIAKYYKANIDEIIAINGLSSGGAIQIGQKLIIPDGKMPVPTRTYTSSSNYAGAGTGKSRSFPYGQCTWYVSQKRHVPWSGHAKAWLTNARAYGFQTGSAPEAGAIMVMTAGGWTGRLYGHVAYVESVNDGWVTISEMNYGCYACYNIRTLKTTDGRIRGYIY